MSSISTGDGIRITPATTEPDAHGQAALLLAESVLHPLVENRTLTPAEAVDAIRTAAEVKVEAAVAAGESERRMQRIADIALQNDPHLRN